MKRFPYDKNSWNSSMCYYFRTNTKAIMLIMNPDNILFHSIWPKLWVSALFTYTYTQHSRKEHVDDIAMEFRHLYWSWNGFINNSPSHIDCSDYMIYISTTLNLPAITLGKLNCITFPRTKSVLWVLYFILCAVK